MDHFLPCFYLCQKFILLSWWYTITTNLLLIKGSCLYETNGIRETAQYPKTTSGGERFVNVVIINSANMKYVGQVCQDFKMPLSQWNLVPQYVFWKNIEKSACLDKLGNFILRTPTKNLDLLHIKCSVAGNSLLKTCLQKTANECSETIQDTKVNCLIFFSFQFSPRTRSSIKGRNRTSK